MSWKDDLPENHWMSFSDLMTGLMVVFLFVAIAYIAKNNQVKAELEKQVKSNKEAIDEYVGLRQKVFYDLEALKNELGEKWEVEIDEDLSVRLTDNRALFERNTANMKPGFTAFLDDFLPLFLNLITDKKYKGKLAEVRIEGHTGYVDGSSSWVGNTNLSQRRSNAVLNYMLNNEAYTQLSLAQKDYLNFILTSNGLAYGKAFSKDGEYLFYSNKEKDAPYYTSKEIDNVRSLRVEFRIVTSSDELVKKLLNSK